MSSDHIRRFHPESEFGGFTDIDGGIVFYARAQELLRRDGVVLDIGCGRGAAGEDPVRIRRELRTLKGRCRCVIGIDVDSAAAENPMLDEFRLIAPARPWPVDNGSVDLAIADFVLEHVEEPDRFFAQVARVVRPGGYIGIRTINARGYVGLASRLVPNRLHGKALARVQRDRGGEDVFPTLYRCNTVRQLRGALAQNGFESAVYGFEAEPAYLAFSTASYAAGLLYRRLVPGSMRVGLVAWGRRALSDD